MKTLSALRLKVFSLRNRLRRLSEDEGEGVWRTVMGRRIFIGEGEDVEDAFRRDKKGKPLTHERDVVTKDRLKQMFKDGRWEAVSDPTRQGFQELRNTKTKDRFTVRIKDWTPGENKDAVMGARLKKISGSIDGALDALSRTKAPARQSGDLPAVMRRNRR